MPWPLSQDYNEAIQSPGQSFADPDLRQGEATTNALGLPVPCSGNFADVYAVVSGQRKWAVKCFTREIPGIRDRYAEISKYLQQIDLPFMVAFNFLERGIRVRGQWYPILKMQWVEGLALNTLVREKVDKPQTLQAVCQIWVKMAAKLREANLAHGDLQHGNVLLVAGSKATAVGVKLVDYDGMCVPSLEMLKATEVGHPSYQHPQRLRQGTYGLHVDRFSHLVVYTALRALMTGGKPLWERFDNGDNLLFTQRDFEAPNQSAIFKQLLTSTDLEVRKLAGVLAEAARQPVEQVPILDDLLPSATSRKTTILRRTPEAPVARPFTALDRSTRSPRRKKGGGKLLAGLVVSGLVAALAVGAAAFIVMGARDSEKRRRGDDKATAQGKKEEPKSGNGSDKLRKRILEENKPEPKAEPKPEPKPAPQPQPKPARLRRPKPEPTLDPEPEAKPQATSFAGTKAGQEWSDNGLKMNFCWCPPGEFTMGGQVQVKLTMGFWLGKYEVTQGEWQKLIGSTLREQRDKVDKNLPLAGEGTTHPMYFTCHDDATDFCRRLTEQERAARRLPAGWEYRLPTEAQWEYACRAWTTTAYGFGDAPDNLGKYAWFIENAGGISHPVGSKPANAWGLHDMHGNVAEWCRDWYQETLPGGVNPEVTTEASLRVVRGGGWPRPRHGCASAFRGWNPPGARAGGIGFRVALVPTRNELPADPKAIPAKQGANEPLVVGPYVEGKLLKVQPGKVLTLQLRIREGNVFRDVVKEFELGEKVLVRVEKPPLAFTDRGSVKLYSPNELDSLKGEDKTEFGYKADMDLLKPNQMIRVFLGRPKSAPATDPMLVFRIHVAGNGQ